MDDASSKANIKPTSSTASDVQENDFQNTSRVGRRNALPDILNDDGTVTTASDSPTEKLSTNDVNVSIAPSTASKSPTPNQSIKK